MHKLIVFFMSIMFASVAHAAQPSEESIETLLTITKMESLMEESLVNVTQSLRDSMAAQLQGKGDPVASQHVIDTLPARVTQIYNDMFPWDIMQSLYIKIYQEHYTQEEVDTLIALYSSPVGARLAEKMPLVMQRTMMLYQPRMALMMEKLEAVSQQTFKEALNAK